MINRESITKEKAQNFSAIIIILLSVLYIIWLFILIKSKNQ